MNRMHPAHVAAHLNPPSENTPGLESNLVEIFKQLSDPTRLRILMMLMREQELNVTEMCERLEQSQPAVSHHLSLLRLAGLVQTRRAGKHIFYSIRNERFHFLIELLFRAIRSDDVSEIQFDNFVLSRSETER